MSEASERFVKTAENGFVGPTGAIFSLIEVAEAVQRIANEQKATGRTPTSENVGRALQAEGSELYYVFLHVISPNGPLELSIEDVLEAAPQVSNLLHSEGAETLTRSEFD